MLETKRARPYVLWALSLLMLIAVSCKKNDDPSPGNSGNPPVNPPPPPTPVLEDTICRKWEITEATHNGTPDFDSKGMQISIYKDGSYLLYKTGYKGTWEFIENKSKVLLDKNVSQYKTTWLIEELSSKKLRVSFISPFTGGNVVWVMKAV